MARNLALRNAIGRYITFLDSDDILDTNYLEKQVEFIKDNGPLISAGYRRQAEHICTNFFVPNKVSYKKDLKGNPLIIWSIYSRHFKKLEDVLNARAKDAIVVVEEGSDPEIDRLILDCFNWLRTRKMIIRLKKLYFTKKSAVIYPAGTELADFTSKSIYGVYRNTEFITVLRKIHNSPINNTKYLEFFDAPAQKRKNLPWKSMQGGGKCGLECK